MEKALQCLVLDNKVEEKFLVFIGKEVYEMEMETILLYYFNIKKEDHPRNNSTIAWKE